MRGLVGLSCVLVLSGCGFGLTKCLSNGDCATPGTSCDIQVGYCVAEGDAGGGAGGGATGGGGGTTGGGGGATGGGGPCGACDGVGQACVVDACTNVPLALTLDDPAPVGALPVTVTFQVTRQGGGLANGVVLPTSVNVAPMAGNGLVTSMATQLADAGYSFTVSSTAFNSTTSALVTLSFSPAAGGTVMASKLLPVDTRQSTATIELVEVLASDAGVRGAAWAHATVPVVSPVTPRRDETVVVRASSNSAFLAPTMYLATGSGLMQTMARATTCSGTCPLANCACFEADLWTLPMRALTTFYRLRFTAQNERGVAYDGGIPGAGFGNANGFPNLAVTRLRWLQSVAAPIRSTPALDSQGTLYFGTQGPLTGALYALGPDGRAPNATWQGGIDAGSVTSVAVSPEEGLVYFTANDATQGGYLSARTTAGLAPPLGGGAAPQCRGAATQRANLAMALLDAGTRIAAVTGFGAATGANFGFCLWNPDLTDSFQPKEANDNGPAAPTDDLGVSNLFVTLKQSGLPEVTYAGHFGGADGGVVLIRRPLSSGPGAFSVDAKVLPNPSLADNGVIPASLSDFGDGARAALSTNLGATGFYKVSPDGGSQSNFTAETSKGAVDALGHQWVLSNTELSVVDATSNVPMTALSGLSPAIGSPVLGATAANAPHLVYVVTKAGQLGVAPQQGAGAEVPWLEALPLVTGTTVSASPTLDCNRLARAPARSSTGVLYVVTNGGGVLAVVVDSAKLDGAAKWPKFQRDIFNTGNTSLTFSDGCP